jgi:hypothetical protein
VTCPSTNITKSAPITNIGLARATMRSLVFLEAEKAPHSSLPTHELVFVPSKSMMIATAILPQGYHLRFV